MHEILYMKWTSLKNLNSFKIGGYQYNIKKANKLSFEEKINVQYNAKAKRLIKEQITSNSCSKSPF